MQMPYETVVSMIKEKAGLSDAEIGERINRKLEQLAGLISKEGAAHIIANELGIKLFEQFSGRLQVKNILAGMRNVEVVGKAVQVFEIREFARDDGVGHVGSFILGDETGTIRVACWGDKAQAITTIKNGDVVKVEGAYTKENSGRKELHLNDRAKLIVNPPGEKVGEVQTVQQYPDAVRKKISELTEADQNAELLGTIVQVFEPRFFEVCSQCGARASPKDGKFFCEKHGAVTPEYSYVFNASLDDGTGTIRCGFFRQQASILTGRKHEQMLIYREFPEKFDEVKNELLGNIVKLIGRVKNNAMFGRMEFTAMRVDANPDPQKEIERLKPAK